MTALGKLLRTTAFKLTLVYLTVFALIVVAVTIYRRFRQTERDLTELARQLALSQAQPPDDRRGDE